MSNFLEFKKSVNKRLDFLNTNSEGLFVLDVDKDELWNLYLDSFPKGTNEVFRERRHYDCSCCRTFIKNLGLVAGIINNSEKVTIWNSSDLEYPFNIVADKLNEFLSTKTIKEQFFTKFHTIGTNKSYEIINDKSHEWDHFCYIVPNKHIIRSKDSVETAQSKIRQTKEVIQRSFFELTPSAIDIVIELIDDKVLYRGEEHLAVLTAFRNLQRAWILSNTKDEYSWEIAVKHGRFAAIRNTAIGTLLVNISEGMDLELAIKKYEQVVAPANYKRPKAVFTKSMIENAQKTIEELGLTNSLARKYAKLEEVSIQDVIWASGDSKKVMKNPFDLLHDDLTINNKSFSYAEELSIDDFINTVLPSVEKLEVHFDNNLKNNLVSLISPVDISSPSLFKWKNGFSWSYAGNFTDSIKESVKLRGGNVEGELRFSLSWAEGDSSDNSDLDAHCKFPRGTIYYANKSEHNGKLDVDITQPNSMRNSNIVENIVFTNRSRMTVGNYEFSVHNFALRGNQKGFKAQIEFDGQVFDFVYNKPLRDKETVIVALVHYDGKNFSIIKSLPNTQSSQKVWNVNTMQFVPVTTVMYSPNHWQSEEGIGNKHYFFMLENCVNNDTARGFYNEFLRNDLIQHKNVFEALGNKMKVEHTDNQLSGLGFSNTLDNTITVKVNNSKILKLHFNNGKFVSNSSKKKVSV